MNSVMLLFFIHSTLIFAFGSRDSVVYPHDTPDEIALDIVMARDGNMGMGTDKKPDIYLKDWQPSIWHKKFKTMHGNSYPIQTTSVYIRIPRKQ